MFCAGHDFLPDGRLLVAGGHISDTHGLANTNVFDPATGTWQAVAAMAKGRWYPTNTTLPSGEVVTIAGTDESGANVPIPEVWNGTAWRPLTSASLELPYYPRTFVAPDGRIFYAGEEQRSRYLDVTGTGSWSNGPLRQFGTRDYGAAVMYQPGKILYDGWAFHRPADEPRGRPTRSLLAFPRERRRRAVRRPHHAVAMRVAPWLES